MLNAAGHIWRGRRRPLSISATTPNRTGTYGRRGDVDLSSTTAIDDRIESAIGKCKPTLNLTGQRYLQSQLTFEGRTEKIAFAPNQLAKAHCMKTVKRNPELRWHDAQTVQPNAGAEIGNVTEQHG
jgi:hypothetical protein